MFEVILNLPYSFEIDFELNNYKHLLFIFISFLPITGEIPKFRWLYAGIKLNPLEFFNRLLYYAYVVPYYIISRILLITSHGDSQTI